MINPISIATQGYLNSTISITTDGYIAFETDINKGGSGLRYVSTSLNNDDDDIMLIISVFMETVE